MTGTDPDPDAADVATGVFAGPITGLKYQTPTRTGITNERGEFQYRKGESVTFLRAPIWSPCRFRSTSFDFSTTGR